MAGSMKAVKLRIKSVQSTMQITKAMQLVAASKLRKAKERADASKPYLETLTVYRKIATAFLERSVLLMHGSVVAVDGEAYMFTALSGTGKSTHVRLWRKLFGDRAVMVNDDKPLVRIGGERAIVYGTPWDGKHHLSNNIAVPLKAIVVLRRGLENEIHPLTVQEAFPTLLQQSFRTEDPYQGMNE